MKIINGQSTEAAIEEQYSKGMGNMNLPQCDNISKKLFEDGMKNRPNMTDDQVRRLKTESLLATDKEEMSQLVDRLASNDFQG